MISINSNPHELQEQLVVSPLVLPDALSQEEVRKILEATTKIDISKATVDSEVNTDIRSCNTGWLPYNDETAWIYGRLYDLVEYANENGFFFDPIDMVEPIMYCEYIEGDHYAWHVDIASPPPFSGRKLAVTVQLSTSDEYRGGSLMFNTGGVYTAPRSQGTIIIYPTYLLHSVEPVRAGKRKSLVFWVGGNNFR
jgi:PKHD-type hydroxylase